MSLRDAANTAVNQCLALQPDETCLVITDDERRDIGTVLYEVAGSVTDDTIYLQYRPLDEHGQEPLSAVAAAFRECDVFLAPTTRSLSHTRARQEACEAGARGATLPGITEDVFVTGLDADYDEIYEKSKFVLSQVADADEVRVTTDAGTDITFGVGDRDWLLDTGIVHDPGGFSNLPAGEVFISPETATGTYVVDGTMRPHGSLDGRELRFEVEDGYVTDISDDAVRAAVESAAESVGRDAYNVAELGIGTNVGVTDLVGNVLLDEKAAGTVHIAIGDDASIGGDTDAPIHTDGIIRDPTVYADGDPIELPGQ